MQHPNKATITFEDDGGGYCDISLSFLLPIGREGHELTPAEIAALKIYKYIIENTVKQAHE